MYNKRKFYKIILKEEPFKYPIYAELITNISAEDGFGYESSIFKELLTGLDLYRGYTHPLLSSSFNSIVSYYPYTSKETLLERIKESVGPVDGLYFDEYSDKSIVTEVTTQEIKDYYMSLSPSISVKNNLCEYVGMFDKALALQQKNVEDTLKRNIELGRLENLYLTLHSDENDDADVLVSKLINR